MVVKKKSNIKFFGSVDCDKDGNITSDMPAWYFPRHIQVLQDSIDRKKAGLARGAYTSDMIPTVQGEIEMEEKKLNVIKRTKPNLTGPDKDKCYDAYKKIAEQIGDSMPTRRDSKLGLADPYKEMGRLKEKHFKVEDAEIAKACGVNPVGGKISGDEANKMYQILGRALNENTNVEKLRKDGGQNNAQTVDALTKLILEKFKDK